MKKAIIGICSKQLIVAEGDVVALNLSQDSPSKLEIENVLSVWDKQGMLVGDPNVKGAKVLATVVGRKKGKKVVAETYKAKSHYHRKIGSRQILTQVRIEEINSPKLIA